MKTIFHILFNTPKGLKFLDEQYEDDLYRGSLVIFVLTGLVSFISNFDFLEESKFLIALLFLVLTICAYIILGMVYAFILHRIGRLLKGEASFTEVCSLYAYSLIPQILLFIVFLIIDNLHHFYLDTELVNSQIVKKSLLIVTSIISVKILVQGMIKFNRYNMLRAIINILPSIIFTILMWYFVLRW